MRVEMYIYTCRAHYTQNWLNKSLEDKSWNEILYIQRYLPYEKKKTKHKNQTKQQKTPLPHPKNSGGGGVGVAGLYQASQWGL